MRNSRTGEVCALLTIAHSQAQADVADKAAVRDLKQLSLSQLSLQRGK